MRLLSRQEIARKNGACTRKTRHANCTLRIRQRDAEGISIKCLSRPQLSTIVITNSRHTLYLEPGRFVIYLLFFKPI